ncbi:MAG: peptidylprolyl isomerase [Candidatus Binatia bacterium]
MPRRAIILSPLAACALLFTLSFPLPAKVIEQIIVAIDGEPYTLTNLKEYAKSRVGLEFPKGELNSIGQEDKEVLEQFITEKLVGAEVKRLGIAVSEADIDEYIAQIKERNGISDADLDETLRREGVGMEKYRSSIKTEIEKGEIINSQVRKKVNITSEDVERYYKLNATRYADDEKIHLRHILLSLPQDASSERRTEVMQKALEIRQQTMAGEDFAELARKYSEGAGAAEGGDIGWVSKNSLLKEIEEVARQLAPGTVSQPLRTMLGIHLIKVEGKLPPRPLPLHQVAGKIKEELYAKALEERFQKWLKGDLRKRYRVDVKLPGVVFRAEETNEGTVSSLMTAASRRDRSRDSGFFSYLNPLSYIFTETPVDEDDPVGEKKIVSIFGVPLFATESAEDVPEIDLSVPPEGAAEPAKPEESRGFFSSMWKAINPLAD